MKVILVDDGRDVEGTVSAVPPEPWMPFAACVALRRPFYALQGLGNDVAQMERWLESVSNA